MDGPIDGKAIVVTITPAITAVAYAIGGQVGGLNTLTNAMDMTKDTGTIMSITVIDKSKQKSALNIYFFNQAPTLVSANAAPLNISDADMASSCLGVVNLAATDYTDLLNSSVATKYVVGLMLQAIAGETKLYCVVQSAGAPTYTSTSDLVIKIGIVQD